jgi:uncharacterized protein (DUF1501 family)
MRSGPAPILNLTPTGPVSFNQQQRNLELLTKLNQRHLAARDGDDQLAARIRSYELAFRMQAAAPELVDLRSETLQTQSAYGLDDKDTQEFGRRCLLARRLIEQGVRFVQVYSGDTNGWDAHNSIEENHSRLCRATDRPVSALLRDLKQRGLLDDTLVIWGGEFGRMPMSEQGAGRDHNPWGYSVWLAGGGVRRGFSWGSTDDVGLRAVADKVPIADFHATILHLLGLDHESLSWFHNGLEQRLTGPDHAHVVQGILA